MSEIGNGVVVSSGRTALRAAGAGADVCAGSRALRAAVICAAGAVAVVCAGSRALADVAVRLVSLIVSSFFRKPWSLVLFKLGPDVGQFLAHLTRQRRLLQ